MALTMLLDPSASAATEILDQVLAPLKITDHYQKVAKPDEGIIDLCGRVFRESQLAAEKIELEHSDLGSVANCDSLAEALLHLCQRQYSPTNHWDSDTVWKEFIIYLRSLHRGVPYDLVLYEPNSGSEPRDLSELFLQAGNLFWFDFCGPDEFLAERELPEKFDELIEWSDPNILITVQVNSNSFNQEIAAGYFQSYPFFQRLAKYGDKVEAGRVVVVFLCDPMPLHLYCLNSTPAAGGITLSLGFDFLHNVGQYHRSRAFPRAPRAIFLSAAIIVSHLIHISDEMKGEAGRQNLPSTIWCQF